MPIGAADAIERELEKGGALVCAPNGGDKQEL